ncbi:MAG: glycosyltransferase family 10 [Sumerlaeia bacterium]
MIRVLVRPVYSSMKANRLFERRHDFADHWMEPYARLREIGLEQGVRFDTWDLGDPEAADVVLFQDLPLTRARFEAQLARFPRAARVLQLIESPLDRRHLHRPENHAAFNAISTWNHELLAKGDQYVRYALPLGRPDTPEANLPFAERKPLVLLNSNRRAGWLGRRREGLAGWPGLGVAFTGWKAHASDVLRPAQGELYSRRRRIASLAEDRFPGVLEIYGQGWRGEERLGWAGGVLPTRRYRIAQGPFRGNKTELLARYRFVLAFENVCGDLGYISEKIFDPMFAGAVPIYLGDARITDVVPEDAFVDARRFASDREMLAWVRDCSEAEWQRLREGAVRFLAGEDRQGRTLAPFEPEAFAEAMLKAVQVALANHSAEH